MRIPSLITGIVIGLIGGLLFANLWNNRTPGVHEPVEDASTPTKTRAIADTAGAGEIDAPSPATPALPPGQSADDLEETSMAGPPLTLAEVLRIEDEDQRTGKLEDLVRRLIEENPALDEETREQLLERLEAGGMRATNGIIGNVSRETALAFLIGELPENDAVVQEWRAQFARHPDRAAIFAGLSGASAEALEAWERATAGWTPWEQQQYRDLLMQKLATQDPAAGLAALQENPDLYTEAAIRRALNFATVPAHSEGSGSGSDWAEDMIAALEDPRLRQTAIEARARHLARENTVDALDWADSLPTQEERDRAHEVIYESTPRGIGIMMRQEAGFPTVVEAMKNGPSAGLLQSGDRIVSITEQGDGTSRDLYNQPFRDVIDSIRGEPGAPVTLKVLRWNEAAERMTEVDVQISREQLYFEGDE